MNGTPMTRFPVRRFSGPTAAAALFLLLTTGCVEYTAHVKVEPDDVVRVVEKVRILPEFRDSLRVQPDLAWASLKAITDSRGGTVTKDRSDSLAGAEASYRLDDWPEFGQKGPAFKGIDEVERRTSPAIVQSEVKDQYFYKDTTLEYTINLKEPTGATVDSAMAPMLEHARGQFELEVPGTILETNAPRRQGNTSIWPLSYGESLEAKVIYRRYEWTAMVSTALVAIFLAYLAFQGIRRLAKRRRVPQPA